MKNIFLVIVLSTLCMTTHARSKRVHVWFLTPPKVVSIPSSQIIYSEMLTSNDNSQCEKMEGGCFDPQRGFIEDDSVAKKKDPEVDISGFTGDLVKCEKGNHFDIYCGKTKGTIKYANAKVGMWIDISGSMKDKDFAKNKTHCQRRKFVELMLNKCKNKVAVSLFDTSIFALGDFSNLCMSRGTNNTDRLIGWIESSTYEDLYIITDIEENNMKFQTYIKKIRARTIGSGSDPFYASNMEAQLGILVSQCKK